MEYQKELEQWLLSQGFKPCFIGQVYSKEITHSKDKQTLKQILCTTAMYHNKLTFECYVDNGSHTTNYVVEMPYEDFYRQRVETKGFDFLKDYVENNLSEMIAPYAMLAIGKDFKTFDELKDYQFFSQKIW